MSKRLKIGFVLDDSLDKPDGVQQYVLALGRWLSEQGHEVRYLVGETKRTDVAGIHSLGKNVAVRFNANRMSIPLPTAKNKIHRLLTQEQFDVLHVQLPYSPWLAQRVIQAAGPKTAVVGTFHIVPHSWYVQVASRGLAVWTRRSLKRFDRIVSVSSAAQAFARKTFKLETEVLPNVVDYARFASARPYPHHHDVVNIVFLGRLVPRKGCLTLLEAVHHLVNNSHGLPGYRVIVCGKGPLEADLKAYVDEHHLPSFVEFTGFVGEDEKVRYLRSADIAVFPSSGGESFGIVLIEAMAAHAAVLAGDNIGYRSVMQPRDDLLFPPKDYLALADKLSWLLRDAAARKDAQHWGKKYAKQFDVAVVGQQLSELYSETLRNM